MSSSDDHDDSLDGLLQKVAATDAAPETAGVPAFAGRYRVGEPLGRGGLGLVHAAWDPELDREVAVKFVRPDRAGGRAGERLQTRLRKEAQALAQLAHPHVVKVFDVGEARGQVYLAMERVDGPTLTDWLADAPRTQAEILAAFRDAGQGLAAAHDAGVVHRDFKPDNVLVEPGGRVVVVDFGLAHGVEEGPSGGADTPLATPTAESRLTATGAFVGTPNYAAPEQRARAPTTPLSDQYSFCVALHEALTGGLPGSAASEASKLPNSIRQAIDRGLSEEPAHRWPSMPALLSALARRHDVRRWRWAALGTLGILATAWGIVALRDTPNESSEVAASVDDPRSSALQLRIEAARDLADAGAYGEARTRLEAILVEASEADDDAASANAELGLAWVLDETGDPGARGHFEAAFFRAQAAEVHEFAFESALKLALLEHNGSRRSAARQWLEHARTHVGRVDRPTARADLLHLSGLLQDDERARLRDFEGAIALYETDVEANFRELSDALREAAQAAHSLSRTDLARAYLERARELCEATTPPDICAGPALSALGNLERDMGNYGAAVELLRRAVLLQVGSGGADDVHAAGTRSILGVALTQLGQPEEARAELEEAIRVFDLPRNRDDLESALALEALGYVHTTRGDAAAAEQAYQRALITRDATVGRDHQLTAYTLLALASTAYDREDYAASMTHALESRRVATLAIGPETPFVGSTYFWSARIQLARKQHHLAREDAVKAVSLLTGSEASPVELAQARFLLGRLTYRDRRSHDQARKLARQAEAFYADAGDGYAEDLADVRAWLAKHR